MTFSKDKGETLLGGADRTVSSNSGGVVYTAFLSGRSCLAPGERSFLYLSECVVIHRCQCCTIVIEGSGMPITRSTSANQNVVFTIQRKNHDYWPSVLPYMQDYYTRAKDRWISTNTCKINGTRSLMMKHINCSQMSPFTSI